MWLSKDLVGMLQISQDTVTSLREELAAVRAERDSLKLQAAINATHFDWLRMKTNTMALERAGLIEKAYSIRLPVPELARPQAPVDPSAFSFEHIDDELAKKLGMPIFDHADRN